jgi:sugar/nucleoside kinase (ribokinase family)
MNGIACAGNWILDKIKTVDSWPNERELSNILSESKGPGGSPFNVLIDLKKMGAKFPLLGMGCIGQDSDGDEVINICEKYGLNTKYLSRLPKFATSYTDVINVKKGGSRTFFHCRGANKAFDKKHVPFNYLKQNSFKLFHLGYLLLLDNLDSPNAKYGTKAAELLHAALKAGMETSVDLVSETGNRFNSIISHSLPYTDHLIINEEEAGKLTHRVVRNKAGKLDPSNLKISVMDLLKMGVRKTIVIHYPEGAIWADKNGGIYQVKSLNIPVEKIVGSAGAGDAFCAAVLYGIHEKWDPKETISIACATAATCLSAANTVDGVKSLKKIRSLLL